MSAVLPNYVIVGAPKSGTTSMAKYLGEHPEAYMVPGKELLYFDQKFDEGPDWYRQQFAPREGERLIGEASPSYLFDPQAAPRMHELIPDARLIAMLREPVARAYSQYWHWRMRLGETREWRAAVEAELALGRTTTSAGWHPDFPDGYHYLARSRYRFQLERFADLFGRDRLHVIFFEEFEADPEGSFKDTCRFLGIDSDRVPESVGEVVNAFVSYHPEWLWGILVRIKIGRFIPAWAGAAIYRRMVRVDEPYPHMDADLRDRLREHFVPDNRELEQWLGRPVPDNWSR